MYIILAIKAMLKLPACSLKAMGVKCLLMDVRYLHGDVRLLKECLMVEEGDDEES
jgi:hypothetical protein